jgi:hypothetical protein
MRYQERIYIQNENRAVRNKDILNVNMSSDFCIFKSPSFDVSAATKVQCGPIVCNLSGFSSEDILSAATYDCFTSQSMSGECFSSVTWTTKIYEDNALSYSASYYTATALTGDTPSDQTFFNSLTTGLYRLGYTYDFIDNILTVQKQYGGVKELEYDLCLTWGIKPNVFSCPVGFTATPANDACQKITTSAATNNGSGAPIVRGDSNVVYGEYGTYFYPSLQSISALPVSYPVAGFSPLRNLTGGTIAPIAIVNSGNVFWANNLLTSGDSRLNNVQLSATTTQFLGFSKCINIDTAGTYYIGIAADNRATFKVDGTLYVNFSGSATDNFKKWSVFEFYFTSGKHIIEMRGQNGSSASAFGAEIYYPTGATPFATLTAATSTASTEANAIFSTIEYVGQNWQLGTTIGYSCAGGYAPDFCDPLNPICANIENAAISGISCTGICSEDCTTICADTFPNLTNTSKGVYILDTATATTIPLSFNFTGNTDVFTATSASFKYEVYKYNTDLGVFAVPPVYKSDVSQYYSFSATNVLQQSLPISGLSLDGDYLIKGYYEANACTDFLNRLGKRIDTLLYNRTGTYQLYEPETDFYFVGTTKAESPIFAQSQTNDLEFYDALPLYQQVIIVDDTIVYSQYFNDDINEQLSPTYERTGATFTLVSEYLGDVFVTLNGLTLAKDIDYSLSGYVLTLYGAVREGDIITIVYTRTSTQTIVSNAIQITNAIASGTTNNEGSNKAYYNTTTGKYELYTDNQILDGSRIILILNGITLTFNIDYYLSKTNKKRIILQGTIMVDDIINIIYYPIANVVNGITNNNNNINWYITTPPEKSNGEFLLEYSNSSSFSTYTVNSTIPYAPQVTNYTSVLSLTGNVGTNWYYRVKNIKNYQSICGDIISSTGYSETVKVQIQSNAINSY